MVEQLIRNEQVVGSSPTTGSTSNRECGKKLRERDAKVPAEMPANCYSRGTRPNKWPAVPLQINGVEVFRRKFIAVKESNSYEKEIPALPSRE